MFSSTTGVFPKVAEVIINPLSFQTLNSLIRKKTVVGEVKNAH